MLSCDRLEWKNDSEASGVDTGELWYQFMKLAASSILEHINKADLITNKVRQKRYLLR